MRDASSEFVLLKGIKQVKADIYTEIHLSNRNVDSLIRVLRRLEAFSICSKQRMKTHAIRLEELRAGLNADFADATAAGERFDESRLYLQRTAWEANRTRDPANQVDPAARVSRPVKKQFENSAVSIRSIQKHTNHL
jgi:hypothetical protein